MKIFSTLIAASIAATFTTTHTAQADEMCAVAIEQTESAHNTKLMKMTGEAQLHPSWENVNFTMTKSEARLMANELDGDTVHTFDSTYDLKFVVGCIS